MNPFSFFDYPLAIQHHVVVNGHTDRATGTYIPGSSTSKPISGHIIDVRDSDVQQDAGGRLTVGDRQFITTQHLSVGDRLDIEESDGSTSTWEVKYIDSEAHILNRYSMGRIVYVITKHKE